jgi:glycosyltransferase involved in cell wall biosynthesis
LIAGRRESANSPVQRPTAKVDGSLPAMTDFAVVIPAYRRPAFLADAVASVLGQSLPPQEVVVVADGPETVVPDEVRSAPVTIVEQPHGGEAVARNAGVAATSAPWVCFLDDDDLWHPDRLARAAAHLDANPECRALTMPSWRFGSEPGEGIELVASDLASCLSAAETTEPVLDMSYLDIAGRSYELLLERNRGNISGATVRRDVLEEAGAFPAGYTCAADWVMFINVARLTEWCFLDERLSFVRVHAGTNTRTNPTNGVVTLRAIRGVWDDDDRPTPPHRPLAEYGKDYRWTVQDALWSALRLRRFDLAAQTLREGMTLLPRVRDKAYALVPPPVTWRIEHRADR